MKKDPLELYFHLIFYLSLEKRIHTSLEFCDLANLMDLLRNALLLFPGTGVSGMTIIESSWSC